MRLSKPAEEVKRDTKIGSSPEITSLTSGEDKDMLHKGVPELSVGKIPSYAGEKMLSSKDLGYESEIGRVSGRGFTSTPGITSPTHLSSVFKEMNELQRNLMLTQSNEKIPKQRGNAKKTRSKLVQTMNTLPDASSQVKKIHVKNRKGNMSASAKTASVKSSRKAKKTKKTIRRNTTESQKPVPFVSASRRNTIIGRYRYGAMSKKLKFSHQKEIAKKKHKGKRSPGVVKAPTQRKQKLQLEHHQDIPCGRYPKSGSRHNFLSSQTGSKISSMDKSLQTRTSEQIHSQSILNQRLRKTK